MKKPITAQGRLKLAILLRFLLIATAIGILMDASRAMAQTNLCLPFNMPSTGVLRAFPQKVFSHYFPPLPISIDNADPSVDYYTAQYLNPDGEGGIHASYGGYLRERPLPRSPIAATNWSELDAETDVQRAIATGLDGFTVDIIVQYTNQIKQLLNAAQAVDPGFEIVLMPDMGSITDTNTLTSIVQTLAAYPSCYHLADGRLVVAPYDAQDQTEAWWQGWLSSMKARGINIAFVPVFQNWSAYATAFAPISYGFSDWGDRTASVNATAAWTNAASNAHQYVSIWMHPVAPQDVRPKDQVYWEAQNTANLRNCWQLGAIGKADWVQLITWNDYSEETENSPSTGTQYLFYDLDAYYITWFKEGYPPPIVRDCIYYCYRQQSVYASPDLTQQTAGPFVLQEGTASDNIEAMVFLTTNATLEIEIGGIPRDYAVSPPTAVVTVPLGQGQPIFRLIRNGQIVTSVQGVFPITNSITYQDLLYHGGSSLRPPVTQVPQAYYPRNPTLPPAAPTELTATTASSSQISLSWMASSGATSYNVQRATNTNSSFNIITNVASTNLLDTGLAGGTTYYYVVSALNAGGESANSAQVQSTTISLAPVNLTATLSGDQLELLWPLDHIGWQLQMQTNPPLIGLGTNWSTIIGSNGTNQFDVPINSANGNVFFRLMYQ
jgi:hypothetical protein